MAEILRELTAIKKTNEITSEHILGWTMTVEAHMAKKALIKATKESRHFDTMNKQEQKNNTFSRTVASRREMHITCKSCGSTWAVEVPSLWRELFNMWET